MKRLIILCFLYFYTANSAAREVELLFTYMPSFNTVKITVPDKSSFTPDDISINFFTPVVEINKKMPELTLPPRGKGIDISGIYQCKEDNSLFSVHHYDDRLVLINISQNISFLKDMGIILESDVQSVFNYPIEKFTFIFDKEYIKNAYTLSNVPPQTNLLSFASFKNDTSGYVYASFLYTVKAEYGVPLIPMASYLHNAQITYSFADLYLYFGYSAQTQQMIMDISKDNGSIAYSPRKGCLRIF